MVDAGWSRIFNAQVSVEMHGQKGKGHAIRPDGDIIETAFGHAHETLTAIPSLATAAVGTDGYGRTRLYAVPRSKGTRKRKTHAVRLDGLSPIQKVAVLDAHEVPEAFFECVLGKLSAHERLDILVSRESHLANPD